MPELCVSNAQTICFLSIDYGGKDYVALEQSLRCGVSVQHNTSMWGERVGDGAGAEHRGVSQCAAMKHSTEAWVSSWGPGLKAAIRYGAHPPTLPLGPRLHPRHLLFVPPLWQ